jgi:hypothetical protein
MGEAKRKKAAGFNPAVDRDRIESAAIAVGRFRDAAGDKELRGGDCESHARLLHALLTHLGISSRIVGGFAAWRVGRDAGAMIVHHPEYTAPTSGFPGHFWVEVGNTIVDATAWQWEFKLNELQKRDGILARLEWPAPVMILDRHRAKPLMTVVNSFGFGAYYEERPELRPNVERVRSLPPTDEELALVMQLYEKPELQIIGID